MQAIERPRSEGFLRLAAISCLIVWAVTAALILLRAVSVAEGSSLPAWFSEGSALGVGVQALQGVLMLVCWVGSIYVWAQAGRREPLSLVALIVLIFLGAIFGPLYILFATRHTRARGTVEESKTVQGRY